MNIDWFCHKCTLQFDKKYVFDLHLSLVHGVEMKVKSEPQDCDKKSQTKAIETGMILSIMDMR